MQRKATHLNHGAEGHEGPIFRTKIHPGTTPLTKLSKVFMFNTGFDAKGHGHGPNFDAYEFGPGFSFRGDLPTIHFNGDMATFQSKLDLMDTELCKFEGGDGFELIRAEAGFTELEKNPYLEMGTTAMDMETSFGEPSQSGVIEGDPGFDMAGDMGDFDSAYGLNKPYDPLHCC